MIDELDEIVGRQDIDVLAGPGRFRARGLGADEAELPAIGGNRGRQRPRHRHQRAIERQLADHHIAVEEIRRNDAQRREHGERDGQIEMAAFLGKIGGREIDREPLARQAEADGIKCGAHPLAAFGHRLVGQAHDIELHLARKKLRLDIDRHGLDALKCDRRHP